MNILNRYKYNWGLTGVIIPLFAILLIGIAIFNPFAIVFDPIGAISVIFLIALALIAFLLQYKALELYNDKLIVLKHLNQEEIPFKEIKDISIKKTPNFVFLTLLGKKGKKVFSLRGEDGSQFAEQVKKQYKLSTSESN